MLYNPTKVWSKVLSILFKILSAYCCHPLKSIILYVYDFFDLRSFSIQLYLFIYFYFFTVNFWKISEMLEVWRLETVFQLTIMTLISWMFLVKLMILCQWLGQINHSKTELILECILLLSRKFPPFTH